MWQCLPVAADQLGSTDLSGLMRIHKEIKTEQEAGSEVGQRRVKVIRKKRANLENSFLHSGVCALQNALWCTLPIEPLVVNMCL